MSKYTAYHKTWVHQDFKQEHAQRHGLLIVECSGCDFLERGHTRRADAKKAGQRHEDEVSHDRG
jgi:hypothetical protein